MNRILTRYDPERPMGRLYETAKNRELQATTIRECLKVWGVDALDLGRGAEVDYAIVYEGLPDPVPYDSISSVIGHVEVKCRDVAPTAYPTIWLEIHKRAALNAARQRLGGWARFVVHYNTGDIRWIDTRDTVGMPVVTGGRTDRGLRADVDYMVDIPVGRLQTLAPPSPPVVPGRILLRCPECNNVLTITRDPLWGFAEGVCFIHKKKVVKVDTRVDSRP